MNYVINRSETTDGVEMRAVYGQLLSEMATKDERIAVLDADLMRANGTFDFKDQFKDRWIDVGVAEANMVGIAAGLSTTGMIPFPATFTCFAARRTFDQFFISANYAKQNVKLTGTDPGVSAAFNGGTHMSFEDMGLMRTIPGIYICEPSDPVSLRKLMPQITYRQGSSYLRLHRKAITPIYGDSEEFELGKGKVITEGTDLTIIATGAIMVAEALAAAATLEGHGVHATVVDMHTVKPIDEALVIDLARKTGAILTAENHQVRNGLGSAVAEVLTEHAPVYQSRVGIQDEFGEVGTQEYLQKRFGLTADNLVSEAQKLMAKKAKNPQPVGA
ncbi:MAG: transketolase family protein [Alkalispirochaeta sp.]